jgi:hypothetical protein
MGAVGVLGIPLSPGEKKGLDLKIDFRYSWKQSSKK